MTNEITIDDMDIHHYLYTVDLYDKVTLSKEVMYAIANLINCQKAEIENLKEQFRFLDIECERLEKQTEEQKSEIELLNKEVDRLSLEVLYSDGNMRSMLWDVVDKLKTELIGWDTEPTDEEIEYTIVDVANEIMEEWGLIIEEDVH